MGKGKTCRMETTIARKVDLDLEPPPAKCADCIYRLTPTEIKTLQAIANGLSTREIAALHFVSIKTVEDHRRKIAQKLGITSIAMLTRYAIKKGLVEL